MIGSQRLTEKIRQREFKLNALLDMTVAINEHKTVTELLELFERIVRTNLSIEKLVLYTKEEKWTCLLHFGLVQGHIPSIEDERFFNQSGDILINSGGLNESFDLVIPVKQDGLPIAYLLVGDLREQEIKMSPVIKHMRFMQTLANVLVVAIENKKLHEKNLHQARVTKELELAAEMQAILLPGILPKNNDYEVSAVYRAHQQVGGDYYDFISINEDEVVFCMADVSGKGVSAAFLMANFQAYLRAIFVYRKNNLEEIVKELNAQVMQTAMGEKYITLFIGTYNKKTRVLQYVNCGHNPPVLADASGYTQLLKLGTIGLGMFEELPKMAKGTVVVQPGSTVVCYTDGLVEMEDERCEQFGLERLEQLVLAFPNCSASEINDLILQSINEFRGDMPFVDDLAVLTCRFL
jgi:sigma-B regulation protein RsbU (phosphoserine phosphatase)